MHSQQNIKFCEDTCFDKCVYCLCYNRHLKDLYVQHQSLYVDKLIPGKIARQPFMDTENQLNKKKEECVEKINALMKSLQ